MGALENMQKVQSLIHLLEEWASWQKGYSGPKLTYPGKSAGFDPGGYVSKTFDEMAEESDAQICRILDCAIDDLTPVQNAAIYRRYLASVFRFQRISYMDALAEAHSTLFITLPNKGIVL